MTPTEEQLACINAVTDTHANIIIKALAGAAKTTTLVMIAEAVMRPMLCLAFNKKVQLEMDKRLPSHCKAKTLNGLGHGALMRFLGKRLVVDSSKNYNILQVLLEQLPEDERKIAYESFSFMMRSIAHGKSMGYIPDAYVEENSNVRIKRLVDDQEFLASLEEEPTELEEELIIAASIISIREGLDGNIDFDDQILLPTVFPASFEKYSMVLVDEAQDLSELNHAMLQKICPAQTDPDKPKMWRLIAVGDPNQSIYGFRGAHERSMNLLQQVYGAKEFSLTISFRCPINIVKEARWRAPDMKWPEWAKDGEVHRLHEWAIDDIEDNSVVICRNNAPLFSLAMKMFRHGRYAEIVGNDVGKGLLKIMKKLGKEDTPKADLYDKLDAWAEKAKTKVRNTALIDDKAACIKVFIDQGETLGDAIAFAEAIFNSSGSVKLMTGHKSKGLEFDNVYIMDESLLNLGREQERNLKYVMQTRSKDRLTYIRSEDYYEH